jgi:hypothetical protein
LLLPLLLPLLLNLAVVICNDDVGNSRRHPGVGRSGRHAAPCFQDLPTQEFAIAVGVGEKNDSLNREAIDDTLQFI